MVYRNCQGILINRCCASCKFKDLTRLISSRFCLQHHKSVKPKGHCKEWAMSEQLEAAGSGRGKVKYRAYLRYLLEVRGDESLADQLGIRTPHKTIGEIRQEFESKHGSIFLSL